eukprot:c21119_g1_i1 orf=117-671(+)
MMAQRHHRQRPCNAERRRMSLLGHKKENDRYHKIAGSCDLEDEESTFAGHCTGQLNLTSRNRAFAYTRRLLPQLEGDMKVSVCRMDKTTFDVVVARTGTVLDLKAAVQKLFDRWQVGEDQISWQHVWENFCLCYMNQKLTNDNELLHRLGIKGGEQLYFVRHLTTRHAGKKIHSKRWHFFLWIN